MHGTSVGSEVDVDIYQNFDGKISPPYEALIRYFDASFFSENTKAYIVFAGYDQVMN